jgi:acetyl esterase/lipase
MAAALAILTKQRGDVTFVHQSLYYPVTDAAQNTTSYREFADGPFLTAKAMAWFWDAYLLRASQQNHKKRGVEPTNLHRHTRCARWQLGVMPQVGPIQDHLDWAKIHHSGKTQANAYIDLVGRLGIEPRTSGFSDRGCGWPWKATITCGFRDRKCSSFVVVSGYLDAFSDRKVSKRSSAHRDH